MKIYRVIVSYAKGQAAASVLGDFTDRATAALHARTAALTLFAPDPSAGYIVEVEGFGCGRGDEGMRRASREAYTECDKRTHLWGWPPFPEQLSRNIDLVRMGKLLPIESLAAERVCNGSAEVAACHE